MENLLEILSGIAGDNGRAILAFAAFLGVFIEISPIKINPCSSFFRWIGDCINKNTREQLTAISAKLNNVSDRIDKIEINDMRSAILNFQNACTVRKHTQEEFEHIIDLHSQYEQIIKEKHIENGRVNLAFEYISRLYERSLEDDSFLDSNTHL